MGAQTPIADTYSSPQYQPTYGTSFSSPLVSGTAGLMKAVNPALTSGIAHRPPQGKRAPVPGQQCRRHRSAIRLCSAAVTAVQDRECICNTQVCGAGMLNAAGAVLAAQRPAVFAAVTGNGRQVTLDGSQSAAATGRSIASYLWTVESTSGGAASPTIVSPTQAHASVPAPSTGSYSLRLTVKDNLGGSDSAIVAIMASGDNTSTSPPPTADSGGGGTLSILFLLLAAMLLLARHMRLPAAMRGLARRPYIHGSAAGPCSRLVEGITEYLPVSSTGHLLIAQRLLGIGASDAAMAMRLPSRQAPIVAVLGTYRQRWA